MSFQTVGVIGGGAWGTGLACAAARAGRDVVLWAREDEVVDIDSIVDWLNSLAPGPELVVLEGASHFFHGRLPDLRRAVSDFLDDLRN